LEERTVTIEKKSLISTLNTTKKAVVASSPAAGSTAPAAVKAGVRAGTHVATGRRTLGAKNAMGKKLGAKTALGKKLARLR
jgi:hypothetical protein